MTVGASKAATTITHKPALAPSPQPRPAPTARALPSELVAQRGPFWMPIRGPNPTPIDSNVKRWRNAEMALRWAAAGMMEATKGFRRLKAHKQLHILRAAMAVRHPRNEVDATLEPQANAA